MKRIIIFIYVLFILLGTSLVQANGGLPQQMVSMFLDEVSLEEDYLSEEVYGLEIGKNYKLSFMLRKDPQIPPEQAYLSMVTQLIRPKAKPENHFLVEKAGIEIPADGKWHKVEVVVSTLEPVGKSFKKGRYGAFVPKMILYNKSAKKVSIKDMSGIPLMETYAFLGDKNQSLPKILLIGDSTMMHTYPEKVRQFKDKAEVFYIPVNSLWTGEALKKYRRWVGEISWDIIYFNSGIHDLTRIEGKNKSNQFKNRISVEEYQSNLKKIGEYLKQQSAKIIWRSITPLGPNVNGRLQADEKKYNHAAKEVMTSLGIAIHDVTQAQREKLLSCLNDGVHFNRLGNEILAKAFYDYLQRESLLKF